MTWDIEVATTGVYDVDVYYTCARRTPAPPSNSASTAVS